MKTTDLEIWQWNLFLKKIQTICNNLYENNEGYRRIDCHKYITTFVQEDNLKAYLIPKLKEEIQSNGFSNKIVEILNTIKAHPPTVNDEPIQIEEEDLYNSIPRVIYDSIYRKVRNKDDFEIHVYRQPNKQQHKYSLMILLYFINHENIESFKKSIEKDEPKGRKINLNMLAEFQTKALNRSNQWFGTEQAILEFLQENWFVVAHESRLMVKDKISDEDFNKVKEIDPHFSELHYYNIDYDKAHPYWIKNLKFERIGSYSFFKMTGLLETSKSNEPIYQWNIEAICSLRENPIKGYFRNIPFLIMDFEMTPTLDQYNYNRTFGHAYFKRRTSSGERWDGYYLTNRLRDPRKNAKVDKLFTKRGSTQIATGRCSLVVKKT